MENTNDKNFHIISKWENMFTAFYWDTLPESIEIQQLLKEYSNEHNHTIKKGARFYRARIFDPIKAVSQDDENFNDAKLFWEVYTQRYFENKEDLKNDITNLIQQPLTKVANLGYLSINEQIANDIAKGFCGYNAENSGAPKKVLSTGRANDNSVVLYLSKDEQTCVYEIKPSLQSVISVATFKAKKDLKLADFSNKIKSDFSAYFIRAIYSDLHDEHGYLKSQIITRYIKDLSYDGVIYNSAQKQNDINLAIFDPNNFECVSSKLVKINSINYDLL